MNTNDEISAVFKIRTVKLCSGKTTTDFVESFVSSVDFPVCPLCVAVAQCWIASADDITTEKAVKFICLISVTLRTLIF